jgi:hypothetical protein
MRKRHRQSQAPSDSARSPRTLPIVCELDRGRQTAERADACEDPVKVSPCVGVAATSLGQWECGEDDGLSRVVGPPREALPELFGDKGHEGVQ